MTDFRPCLICLSHSQAILSHFTLNYIHIFKITFALLRYILGEHRPSETTCYTLSKK